MKQTLLRWTRELRLHFTGLEPGTLRDQSAVLLGWAVVLVAVCAAIWALKEIPRWQVNELLAVSASRDQVKAFELENEARKTLTQIVLGSFALIVLFFTWRRVRANDRSVRVLEQGHITDRYTKAIEQLGKVEGGVPNIEVRLGAIYALERIARDSPRDHWTIVEVLSAYVRRNAPRSPRSGQNRAVEEPLRLPRTDIQTILTILGRRPRGRKRERRGQFIDLGGSDLRGGSLSEAHLEGANLKLAQLEYAKLIATHLEGANLSLVLLGRANLSGAHLEGADLLATYLDGADLSGAHLEGANLTGAHLEGANLMAAHLKGANLSGAYLEDASLIQTDLTGVTNLAIEQVRIAKIWRYATYDHGFGQQLDFEVRQMDEAGRGPAGRSGNDGSETAGGKLPERPEAHGTKDAGG